MTETQQKLRSLRLTLVCVGLIGILGLSIYSAYYLLNKPVVYRPQTIVIPVSTPHNPTPVSGTIYTGSRRGAFSHPSPMAPSHTLPTIPMSSSSMSVYRTSKASVQIVGGGGGGVAGSQTNSDNGSRGIQTTAVAYSGAIYIPMVNNAVTEVGATQADEVVAQKMGIIAARKDGLPGYNPDPVPDPDPVTPVGDVTWLWLTVLALGYVWYTKRKCKEAK